MADVTDGHTSRPIRVRRALVGSLDIYEVKDNELEILETGGQAATQLNFAVSAFSFAFSALGTLLTATFESQVVQTFFVVTLVGGVSLGAYCLFQWRQSRTSIRRVIKGIKDRMEEEENGSPSETPRPGTDRPRRSFTFPLQRE
jgi:hypothetical protein